MIKVLIVEDEPMARARLSRMLSDNYPDIQVVGMTSSVKDTLDWLSHNEPELIFMDVELSDGDCFEIFRSTDVKAKVVMTTAYDSYAVKAFEVNSIDYLLKPIEAGALHRSVERCRRALAESSHEVLVDGEKLRGMAGDGKRPGGWRRRFIVRINDKIVPVPVEDVAYIFSEDKNTYLVTNEGARYIIDSSLDVVSGELDPAHFFRISRNCVISYPAIQSIVRLQGSRLRIVARPPSRLDLSVSRSRVDDFLVWLEGGGKDA